MPRNRSSRLLATLCWSILLAFLPLPLGGQRAALGQATDAQFIDPLSSAEFAALVRRHLGATAAEWVVLHTMHGDYVTAALALRDGEVAAFLADRTERMGGILDMGIERELVPRRKRIAASIAANEDRLFDDVAGYLGEERRDAVVGLRLARERTRLEWAIRSFALSPQGEGDPVSVILDRRWTKEERAAILPVLRRYQEKANGILRRMADAAPEASPFNQGTDDAARQASAEFSRQRGELQKLTAALFTEVAALTTPAKARSLRLAWVDRRYWRIASPGEFPGMVILAALKTKGLSAEDRAALEASLAEILAADDRLIEAGTAATDRADLTLQSRGQRFAEDPELTKLGQERRDLAAKSRQVVIDRLGKDRYKAIVKAAWKKDLDDPELVIDPDAPVPSSPPALATLERYPAIERLQRAIDLERVRQVARSVGATPEALALVEAAHAACSTKCDATLVLLIEAYQHEMKSGSEGVPRVTDGMRTGGLAIQKALMAEEAPLFDAMAAALGESGRSAVAKVRLERALEIWLARPAYASMVVSKSEVPWNPFLVLEVLPFDEASRTRLATIALERADALRGAAQALAEADANVEGDAVERARRSWAARKAAAETYASFRDAWLAAIEEASRPRAAAILLQAALPCLFDYVYAAQIFPKVRALGDLTAEQLAQLATLEAAFDERYLALVKRMRPDPIPEPSSERDLMRLHGWSGDENVRHERGQFERSELNAHTVTRLRAILTAEQQARLADLDRLDPFLAPLDRL